MVNLLLKNGENEYSSNKNLSSLDINKWQNFLKGLSFLQGKCTQYFIISNSCLGGFASLGKSYRFT